MHTRTKVLVAAALTGGLLVGGTTVAGAQTTEPTPTEQVQRRRHVVRHAAHVVRRSAHGEAVVKRDGQWVTIAWDRGTLTKVDGKIQLTRPDGVTVTLAVDADTKYLGVSSYDDLQDGKGAVVFSQGGVADRVAQRAAS